ncbi:hypothetical protein SDC9_137007 [bioreactor metagenome]|uniref:Trimethylamine methyltransferase n=1 Tax=bioreactor metagenome TaxID=1076179 RepID=A0A645DMX8_9ZZZZ
MRKYNIERNVNFSILSQEEIEFIHEKSLELIETVGMKICGDHAQEALKAKGVIFDENDIAKIPRELILEALETVPKEITLYNRMGQEQMVLNSENRVY